MILNFREWVYQEMAFVSKEPVYLDETDIQYLKQFPVEYWASALQQRYGEIIFQYLQNPDSESEYQTITVTGRIDNSKSFNVKTYVKQVIEKLKEKKYDLSGMNPLNKTSLYYSIMTMEKAKKLASQLFNTIPSQDQEIYKRIEKKAFEYRKEKPDGNWEKLTKIYPRLDVKRYVNPKPNEVYFSPNHLMQNRNDPEPGAENTAGLLDEFNSVKPKILELVEKILEKNASTNGHKEINAKYWLLNKNLGKIKSDALEYMWNRWNDADYRSNLPAKISGFISTYLQKGLVSRRKYEPSFNYGDMLKQHQIDS